MAEFKHFDLRIVEPEFDSQVTDYVISLEKLRDKLLRGSTPAQIFFQLKQIFHTVESLGSARIEGNRTTLAEYVETKITPEATSNEDIIEIENMESAMSFIEENMNVGALIDKAFLLELHKIVVKNLTNEGDRTPGLYRTRSVEIVGSNHLPPNALHVDRYMEELIEFINEKNNPKYDLLKSAIAHHRFSWVHPFNNGNGRVVRLLTYAMLIKHGFNVGYGRILNPTAVFCIDRNKYNKMLSIADSGDDESTLKWCAYVLDGLAREIEKIDNLTDYEFLKERILIPSIDFCLERGNITKLEFDILKIAIEKEEFQSVDLKGLMQDKLSSERSRVIRKLRENKLIAPTKEQGRKYVINFTNNYLLRGVINALDKEDFISIEKVSAE